MNIQTTLQTCTKLLQGSIPTESNQLDCELLLAKVLNTTRTFLYTWPEKKLTKSQQAKFKEIIDKRADGIPIAYILEEKDFWDMTFKVTPDTLIPRSDTETLIEVMLKLNSDTKPNSEPLKILDLGTGSGIIAITLKKIWQNAEVLATDISDKALKIAQQNAKTLKTKIKFYQGNWYEALSNNIKHFDFICSNPPYIAKNDSHLNKGSLKFEPATSLISEDNGLSDLEHIIKNSPNHLKSNGYIIIEHGYNQANNVCNLLSKAKFIDINTQNDLQGIPRISYARKK